MNDLLIKMLDTVQMFSIRRSNGEVMQENEILMYLEFCDFLRCVAKNVKPGVPES